MTSKKDHIRIIEEGLEFLNINDIETISYIKNTVILNYHWNKERLFKIEETTKYNNRFHIPRNMDKKFYKELLKETQSKIDFWLKKYRETRNIFFDLEREDYVEKKRKLKLILESKNDLLSDLDKAKAYPVENLLEFNGSGFAKCPFHREKTGSFFYNKNSNTAYCFGGCGKKDVLDIYMEINKVSLLEAINKLK